MRKLAFINFEDNPVKKIMLCPCGESSVYLFAYETPFDAPCNYDEMYSCMEEAQNYCLETFRIRQDDWFDIAPVQEGCQKDFIAPVRIKGSVKGNAQWGSFEALCSGRWVKYTPSKSATLNTLSAQQRLLYTGLTSEFEEAKTSNPLKAAKILKALQFDLESIKNLLLAKTPIDN